jgi:hypothetical protein
MRVDVLHKRINEDARVMYDAVATVLPPQMPPRYAKHALTLSAFIARLNRVTEPLNVFNELIPDRTTEPGTVMNTGLWLPKSELPENESYADVRVLWHTHPTTKRVSLTPVEWQRRRFYFWEMYFHELVHRHQGASRLQTDYDPKVFRVHSTNRNEKEDQTYYGHYDEIEAHAHNAALEFVTWWPHHTYRDCVRNALGFTGRIVIPTYIFYEATFLHAPKHPALRTFKRKTKAWFNEMKRRPELYDLLELPRLV